MPWLETTSMELRRQFCDLAAQETEPFRTLCRRFGISPTTGYLWRGRYAAEGAAGLVERSRMPRRSPQRTDPDLVAVIVALRDAHPCWGGRTLRARLLALGHDPVPSPSTITDLLRRAGRIAAPPPPPPVWQRFEADAPNDRWQMDFKGPVRLAQGRVHPLLVLDDHARYAVAVQVLADIRTATVQAALTALFRVVGLPGEILCDNGPPWGTSQPSARLTRLGAWLLRLGVGVSHGRAYHPQTQGKVERFGRTLGAELLGPWLPTAPTADAAALQVVCDAWRTTYNHERPHQALGLATPASRYSSSPRPFPETPPPLTYPDGATLLRVCSQGYVRIGAQRYYVSEVIPAEHVALLPTEDPHRVELHYGPMVIRHVDLRFPGSGLDPSTPNPLP